jgi:hypothetical protein
MYVPAERVEDTHSVGERTKYWSIFAYIFLRLDISSSSEIKWLGNGLQYDISSYMFAG